MMEGSALTNASSVQGLSAIDRVFIMTYVPLKPRVEPKPPQPKKGPSRSKPVRSTSNYDMPGIQAKLVVGASNDPLEHEADAIADRVVRSPKPAGEMPISGMTPNIQRACTECSEQDDDVVQRSAFGPSQDARPTVTAKSLTWSSTSLRGGAALSDTARMFHEPRFGVDFSGVRVHRGPEASALTHQINARAFTLGRDIYFGEGEYNERSSAGRRLLAHELTHVLQQTGRAPTEVIRPKRGDQKKQAEAPTPKQISEEFVKVSRDAYMERIERIVDPALLRSVAEELLARSWSPDDWRVVEVLAALESRSKQLAIDLDYNAQYISEVNLGVEEKWSTFDRDKLNRILDKMSPYARKLLEKELVLWPRSKGTNTRNKYIELLVDYNQREGLEPQKSVADEESRKGKFGAEEGEAIRKDLSFYAKDAEKPDGSKLYTRTTCLDFIVQYGAKRVLQSEPDRVSAATGAYSRGAAERGRKLLHGPSGSRFATELRLQKMAGPVIILHWTSCRDCKEPLSMSGHHEPSAQAVVDRLSNGGDGWYFFMASVLSEHNLMIAVHVDGDKKRYFKIQGGSAAELEGDALNNGFDKGHLPNSKLVNSRIWQFYRLPSE